MAEVRSESCTACPYRKDVASGVWAHAEYEKLRPYDNETMNQPFGPFMCHATPDHYCHGWAVVHTSRRGNEFDLIALRLVGSPDIPEGHVELFASGNEAADHGQAEIETPSPKAVKTADRLMRKYERLQR